MKPAIELINDQNAERRRRILDAARSVFARDGGLNAGLRPIAAAAGCTTGAIYAVFSSREDIYAALLEESLADLATDVAAAAARESDAEAALRAAAWAFFEYYQTHIFEYNLGLYLFEKDGRKGLGADRDDDLNRRLAASLDVLEACFRRLGAADTSDPHGAAALSHSLFASLIGALAMAVSGRDRSIGTTARQVISTLIDLHVNNAITKP